MLLNVSVIKTKSKKSIHAITCALEIDNGKFSQSISEEEAQAIINLWGLKHKESKPSTRLTNNDGIEDHLYS